MKSKINNLSFRLVAYTLLLVIIWIIFPPVYFKNDDVIMSMISGGYGQMYEKSNLIMASNIILGQLSVFLPNFFGVVPYNYLNILFLSISFISLGETINKITKKFLISVIVQLSSSLFILIRPTFTTIAGYLSVTAMLNIYLYNKNSEKKHLLYGFTLLLFASLIRDEMVIFFVIFTFVIIVQSLKKNGREVLTSASIFSILFIITQIINRLPYNSDYLKQLKEFALVLSPIVDYNADRSILQKTELLLLSNYTINDINLIRNWYFFDLHMIDPSRLVNLLSEFGWRGRTVNLDISESITNSLNLITNYPLNVIFLSSIILMIFSNRNYVLKVLWVLLLLSVIMGALIGRQLDYVYYPIFMFLFILIYVNFNQSKTRSKVLIISTSTLIGLSGINAYQSATISIEKMQKSYQNVSADKIWVIGGGLPLELIYPVLEKHIKGPEIIASDWSIFTPKSYFQKYNSQNNFVLDLKSENGVNVVANNYHIPLIQIYCKEKFGSDLLKTGLLQNEVIRIENLKCPSQQINLISSNMEFEESGKGFMWLTPSFNQFELYNYSDKHFKGIYELNVANNPCNKITNFSLSSSQFNVTTSSLKKTVPINLSLNPYEKLVVSLSVPKGQELCNIEGDSRTLIAKLINQPS
jgi:hypothetical protein